MRLLSIDVGLKNLALYCEETSSQTMIYAGVFNLRSQSGFFDNDARLNVIQFLTTNFHEWPNIEKVIIEQQYFQTRARKGKASGANVEAIKLAEFINCFFMLKGISTEYFQSKNKTKVFAQHKMKDKERKLWAIEFAQQICPEELKVVYEIAKAVKRKRITAEKINGFLEPCKNSQEYIKAICLRVITEKQKLDDISDAFLQLRAYVILNRI